MRIYEQLFIVRPDAAQEEIDSFLEQITGVIAAGGGNVRKVEKWGIRKLAYPVEKRHEGYYVLLEYGSAPDVVKEIERRFRVSDLVLKYLTVRIDQKLKWLEKRKRERERRAQQKPAPQPATVPGEPVPQE